MTNIVIIQKVADKARCSRFVAEDNCRNLSGNIVFKQRQQLLYSDSAVQDTDFHYICKIFWCSSVNTNAFSALTSLGGRKGIRPVKNWMVRYWHGYLSGARCKWSAYGPADATATPSSLTPVKIQNGLPFWCRLTQVVLEKGC